MRILLAAAAAVAVAAAAAAAAPPPTAVHMTSGGHVSLHVGWPGRAHTFRLDFAQNSTGVSFDPAADSLTASGGTERVYWGPRPVRVPYVYSPTNYVGLGAASRLWAAFTNFTVGSHELHFDAPAAAAASLLADTRCGLRAPPAGGEWAADLQSAVSDLPAPLYDAGLRTGGVSLPALIPGCPLFIPWEHFAWTTDSGVVVSEVRRVNATAPLRLGWPVLLADFVVVGDMHTGAVLVGAAADTAWRGDAFVVVGTNWIVFFASAATLLGMAAAAQQRALPWFRAAAIVGCVFGAVAAALSHSAPTLSRLRLRGLPGLPAIVGAEAAALVLAAVDPQQWLVTAALMTVWLMSWWESASTLLYPLLWATLLATWQLLRAAVRRTALDAAAAAVVAVFAVAYAAYPAALSAYPAYLCCHMHMLAAYAASVLACVVVCAQLYRARIVHGGTYSGNVLMSVLGLGAKRAAD